MTDNDMKKFAYDHHELTGAIPKREKIILTIAATLLAVVGYNIFP